MKSKEEEEKTNNVGRLSFLIRISEFVQQLKVSDFLLFCCFSISNRFSRRCFLSLSSFFVRFWNENDIEMQINSDFYCLRYAFFCMFWDCLWLALF